MLQGTLDIFPFPLPYIINHFPCIRNKPLQNQHFELLLVNRCFEVLKKRVNLAPNRGLILHITQQKKDIIEVPYLESRQVSINLLVYKVLRSQGTNRYKISFSSCILRKNPICLLEQRFKPDKGSVEL